MAVVDMQVALLVEWDSNLKYGLPAAYVDAVTPWLTHLITTRATETSYIFRRVLKLTFPTIYKYVVQISVLLVL